MLGDVIREFRVRARLSQEEVAEKGGFSSSWLSRIEANAIASPSPNRLRAIARVLNVSADELLQEAGYIYHAPSIEHMPTEELSALMKRSLAELTRRIEQQSAPTPIRLDERRDGTDPSGRRYSRGGTAVLDRS